MFTLDEGYVEARFFMLMSLLGSPCVPRAITPGQELVYATLEDIDNWEHDEKLVKDLLIGRDSREAVDILEDSKAQFKSSILQKAPKEDFARFFR